MKNIQYAFLFLGIFLFTACGDDDDGANPTPGQVGSLALSFDAYFADTDLSMNQKVDFDGKGFRINVSEFFVSDVTLHGNDGSVLLTDVDYVNFTQTLGSDAETSFTFADVPVGTYTSLTMSIGVNAENNAKKPANFPSTHPLANTSVYWQGWQSYIFSKLEGKLDTAGTGTTDLIYVYHSGKNDLFTPVTINLPAPLQVTASGQAAIDLKMDHKVLFEYQNGYLDIVARPTVHNADDLTYPTAILGNFQKALTIK